MAYFKIVRKSLEITGSNRKTTIDLRAEIFSYDKNVNKFLFELTNKEMDIDLTGATVRTLLTYVDNDGSKGMIEDYGGVERNTVNQIFYLLPEELRGYDGTVVMGLYIDLPTGESIDIQNVQFRMFKSSIDDGAGVAGMIYFKSFEEWLLQVKEKALLEIQNIDEESERITKYADTKIKDYDDKFVQSDQKMSELQQSQIDLSDQLDETNKKIDEADVYRKSETFNRQESSANVINSIGGAESAILKKELLINGVEGTASRYVKDLPSGTNYIVKNSSGKPTINRYAAPNATSTEINNGVLKITKTGLATYNDSFYQMGELGSLNNVPVKAGQKWVFGAKVRGVGRLILFYRIKGNTGYASGVYDFSLNDFEDKFTSVTLPENVDAVALRFRFPDGATTGSVIEAQNIFFKLNSEKYTPAPEDMGIVHGQPNLLNGTSNEWKEYTFTAWDTGAENPAVLNISDLGLKVGDTVSGCVEIDNTEGTAGALLKIWAVGSEGRLAEVSYNIIEQGAIGVSKGSMVLPEGATQLRWYYAAKTNGTIKSTIKVRRHKLIKGSLEAMDEWTPSQADSGLTPVNDGMVPFNEQDYEDLLSEDGIVRAETNIVGRGAEIEFKFDVIGTLEKKYPYLFEGLSSMAEKIGAVNKILKSMSLVSTFRGGGLNSSSGAGLNFARWNILRNKANSTAALDYSTVNLTADFKNYEISLNNMLALNIRDEGNTVLYLASKKNGNSDNGAISDGVTPAWIEVKDISLTVELEVNGRTIIESMIATNRGTFVTLSEPETIDSLKNFTETPTVNSDPVVVSQNMPAECYIGEGVQTPDNPSSTLFSMGKITGVDFFHKGKDFEMAADGKSVLVKRDMTLYISPTLETRGANNTKYTDFTYCSVQVGDGTNNGATNSRYQVIAVGTDIGSNLLNLTHTKAGHVVADVKAGQKISALVQCREGKLVWNMTFKGMHLREMTKPIKNGG